MVTAPAATIASVATQWIAVTGSPKRTIAKSVEKSGAAFLIAVAGDGPSRSIATYSQRRPIPAPKRPPRAKPTRARGCERATTEFSLRSSVVHPITRRNAQTSCGIRVPIIHVDFDDRPETVAVEMIPKGSGSENGSFLQMLLPSDGIGAAKRFVIDRVIELGGRVCPPTIVGVGLGGTSDLCMHLAKVAATRPLRSVCADPDGARIEAELSRAVNELGICPQGLGGRSTSFAVHVELAATHITQNPVAVNIQCHSARRARATLTPGGIAFE